MGARGAIRLALVLLAGAGCTRTALIGAVCPGPDGGTPIDAACGDGPIGDGSPEGGDVAPGTTFSLELDRSGTSLLEDALVVGGRGLAATLRLRGETATTGGWPADVGPGLAPLAGATAGTLPTPFTDGTRAVGLGAELAFAASAVDVALGAEDFALELVLRAAPGVIASRDESIRGWTLAGRPTGELALALRDDAPRTFEIASAPLVEGAWYHCVFWMSRAVGGRADCDARPGPLVAVAPLGVVDTGAGVFALGGGAAARLAFLAIYRVTPGALGNPSGWQAASARRFFALAGARPRVAGGSATPAAGLRNGPAYVDLQAAGAPRRMFLVGADWPRVACRTDVAGARDCGFLGEPRRTRGVAAAARSWTARQLAVAAGQGRLPEEGPAFEALVPSAVAGPHVLALVRDEIVARQVFSFFARAGASTLVGAAAGARGTVVYDLAAGTVSAAPAGVRATIEPWGDGIFRCTYAFTGAAATLGAELRLHLLDAAGLGTFAGDGATASIEVAALQLDVGLTLAGSVQATDEQAADRLTFVGDDGNLPMGTGGVVDLRILLPAGPRLTDQAILNLNRGSTFEDQIQLFVRGDLGTTKFWGLVAGQSHWTFDHPTSVIDGARHALRLGWDRTTARVELDGVPHVEAVLIPNDQAFVLDRIDVGFSTQSSGALEGLIAGLAIGAPR